MSVCTPIASALSTQIAASPRAKEAFPWLNRAPVIRTEACCKETTENDALAAVKKGLALKAKVMRDGQWVTINAATLVPGDVVSVAGGETLPADLVLTEGKYLSVDQAALTGESLPVSKAIGDVAYSGSIVRQGSMVAPVTSTGNATFFGRTAKLVASAGTQSHADKAVLQMGDFLIALSVILALILVYAQVHRFIVSPEGWAWSVAGQIVQILLVLLVGSVPVAPPAVMSVTMALGALALSKHKAIVSRLSAIEAMPSWPSSFQPQQ